MMSREMSIWPLAVAVFFVVSAGHASKSSAADRVLLAQAPAQDAAPQLAPPAPAPAAKPIEGTPAVVVDGQQLQSILGRKVRADNGDDMGRIVDLLADKSGQMRAAIIDFGGFLGVGNRQIAIDWKAIRFPTDNKTPDSVIVPLSRDQLRVAPAYKAGEQIVVLGPGAPAAPAAENASEPVALGAPKDAPAKDAPANPTAK